jgi:serine/threonine protein kinase
MNYAPASFLLPHRQGTPDPGPGTATPPSSPHIFISNRDLPFDTLPHSLPSISSSLPGAVRELNSNEIELEKVIGEGSFGTVMRAKWREMNIAVKYFKQIQHPSLHGFNGSAMTNGGDYEEFYHEIETMARVCNHMFVIQLIGIVRVPQLSVVTSFYHHGSLEDLLVHKTNEPLRLSLINTTTLIRFALETAIGVRHLHLEGVIHRDLAARNLLLDDNLHIRVSDFGFSRLKEVGGNNGTTRGGYTQSSLGPIRWSAPEAMRRKKYSEASDVFSFGVALYEIFFQEMPWKGMETVDVVISVCGGERMTLSPEVAGVPDRIAELMSSCWAHDPDSRPLLPAIITSLREQKEASSLPSPPLPLSDGDSLLERRRERQESPPSTTTPPSSSSATISTQPPPPPAFPLRSSLSFSSLLSPSSQRGGGNLSLEIVTEPFQQTWEEYHDSEDHATPSLTSSASASLTDAEFLVLVEQHRLHSWGHEATLRVMYLMLQESHRSSKTVEMIIDRFRGIQKEGFHMTIVYFWIQVPPPLPLIFLRLTVCLCFCLSASW